MIRSAPRRDAYHQASGFAYSPSELGMNVTAGDVHPLLAILSGAGSLFAEDLSWQDQAVCAEVDPEIFFPEKGGSTSEPKAVCRVCPVRAECLEWALKHDERFGVYGGKSERERRRIRHSRAAASGSPRSCASGRHLMTPENTYVYPGNNARTCRACKSEREANRVRDYSKNGLAA